MSHESSGAGRPLRILFSMRNYWYVRHFESVIRRLAARGHQVHLLAERSTNEDAPDWGEAAERLAADVAAVTFATAPRAAVDHWYDLRVMLRLALDYIRFTTPEYRGLARLVERARDRTPRPLRAIADSRPGRSRAGRAVTSAILGWAERAVPPDPALDEEIAGRRPDLVIVTPLVELGSEQADVVRIAKRRGIPTALCVGSWDHLSSKGLIRALPDRVIVWNAVQQREAVEMHGVPPGRVQVTGAQCFDEWFGRRPATSRDDFCRTVGLDPSRPFVLYVCSALFEGSPSEAEFVRRWVAALRASSDPVLRCAGVLVRPHPKRAAEWDTVDLGDGVVLWPPLATAPIAPASKDEYFDSLFHCRAVVGLNTSAMIEGGIVGRPVLTVLEPDFSGNQEGTLHFRYLLDGGLLQAARTLPDHVLQLAAALREPVGVRHNAAFVEAFVRPNGLSHAATPYVTEGLEQVAAAGRRTAAPSIAERMSRAVLWPVALATSGRFGEQVARERRRRVKEEDRTARLQAAAAERERVRAARDAQRAAERAEAIARREQDKRAREEEKLRRVEEEQQRKAAARAAAMAEREARLAAKVAQREQKRAEAAASALAAKQRAAEAREQEKAERLERHRLEKRQGMKG